MELTDNKRIVNFIFELSQLGAKPRSGWELLLVARDEPVAVHIMRTAQLAFILAVMEGHPEPEAVAVKALFHDNNETRLPDMNRVAMRYVVGLRNEEVVMDQTAGMGDAGEKILEHWRDANNHLTLAGVIAKDADYLECAFSAKEYMEQGNELAKDWVKNVHAVLRTASAQALLEELIVMSPFDWWQGLKKSPAVHTLPQMRAAT